MKIQCNRTNTETMSLDGRIRETLFLLIHEFYPEKIKVCLQKRGRREVRNKELNSVSRRAESWTL